MGAGSAGRETRLHFHDAPPDDLSLIDADVHSVEPGTFDIMLGPSPAETTTVHLEVGLPGAATK